MAAGHNNITNVCMHVRATVALMIFIYFILLIMRAIKNKRDKTGCLNLPEKLKAAFNINFYKAILSLLIMHYKYSLLILLY